MRKVRILFADHTPFAGGAQLRLAEDLKFLDRKKIEPVLVIDKSSKFASIYNDSNVEICKIGFPQLNLIHPIALARVVTSVREFNQFVKKCEPEIVMANTTRTLLVAALAKKLYDLDFKLIGYIRDYDYPKWIFKLIRNEVDKYLFVSDAVKNFYHLNGPAVCLGSDMKSHLDKVPQSKVRGFRAVKGIGEDDYVIGYLGRLVDWKGGEWLVEAFHQIKDSKAKLIFFGTGEKQKGSVESKLKQLVKKYHLEKKVFFTGFIEDAALALKVMNCFVLPSQKPEPFATSVIEAAFAKIPIIATNIGGTPEFIHDQKNGLLVSPKNTNQLAAALLRLIKEPKLGQKLAEQAFKDAAGFDQKQFIKHLEKELLA